MTKKPKYLRHYEKFFLELNPFMESIREIELNENYFKIAVIAAFTKCYDYNLYNSQSKEYDNSFYKLPMLRGICEDLIALSHLLNKPIEDRNKQIKDLQHTDLYKSLKIQSKFFQEKNPYQIVATQSLLSEENINFSGLPNVSSMAVRANLKTIYDYLYCATSAVVHFNPDILFKLGWGELDGDGNISNAKFSARNYHKYYHAFNTFYAWYLLREQIHAFEDYLEIPKNIMKKVENFNKNFKNSDWPELTTFEHLNIKRPDFFQKATHHMMINLIKNKTT